LLELIERRLSFAGLKWTSAFKCSPEELSKFLEFKLRNGPRDLLRFIDVVLEELGNDKAVTLADFKAKEGDYRLPAFKQMQAVYGDVFKNIGDFVREMFKTNKEFPVEKFREEPEKMRLESRPSVATYEDNAFSDHKEAFKSITESGCVDVKDSDQWLPPYSERYYLTLFHNKATRIRMNYTIRP